MDVADVDSAEGWHGLRHLLGGDVAPGPQVRSGGGGRHLWFRPTGWGNRVRLVAGLDWRGVGGYVLAPPSRHARGADYRWIRRPAVTLPVVPSALLTLIAGPPPPAVRSGPILYPDRYAEAALDAETARVAGAVEGTRNDTLNRAAFMLGRLIGAGLLDEPEVRRELTAAARQAGLGWSEIRGTLRSGLTAGRRHPLATSPPSAA
ncbi:hypothetical protein GCM10009828_032150 [Actinoplanes couchii]|uniref:DNA primase/polymerase bifunctional N-terminal domain-containing protein n=2 Tax=Actinoplanes couchii TaxID=403638 RepID=A0ABQ3XBH1_9ACTN|nr:hypothetical protein Aco03nite_042220 [Actinoplanes couchii]